MENNINFTSSLKSKLILMAAIPALALLYFAGSGVLERQATSKKMVKLDALMMCLLKLALVSSPMAIKV